MGILHVFEYFLEILISIEIGNLAVVEYVIDIFYEGFVDDLCVWQQEDVRLAIDTSGTEECIYHIFAPLTHAVALDHLEADHLVSGDESRQLG